MGIKTNARKKESSGLIISAKVVGALTVILIATTSSTTSVIVRSLSSIIATASRVIIISVQILISIKIEHSLAVRLIGLSSGSLGVSPEFVSGYSSSTEIDYLSKVTGPRFLIARVVDF